MEPERTPSDGGVEAERVAAGQGLVDVSGLRDEVAHAGSDQEPREQPAGDAARQPAPL